MLALGGELKNTFCLIKDGQAILAQHVGDLADAATFADYRRHLQRYGELFAHRPRILAVDRHSEYLSTKLGKDWAVRAGLGLEVVQHHHAHIASCLADNGVPRDAPPVLGVVLDGLGYGEDEALHAREAPHAHATLWGGEFLRADYAGFTRLGTFKPVPMPGGVQAIFEPWRNTYAHLAQALGWAQVVDAYPGLALIQFLKRQPLATLDVMIARQLKQPSSEFLRTAVRCGGGRGGPLS